MRYDDQGYSGSDIRVLSKEIIMNGVRDVIGPDWHKKQMKNNVISKIELNDSHFDDAVARIKASSSNKEEKYRQWYEQYGSG